MYRVGMIGLGKLGLPIARNPVERDFQIIGYRRSGSPELAALGGTVAGSPAEVAGHAGILLSILPNAAAVEEVVFGPAGTPAAMLQDTVHIEMSTIDVASKRGPVIRQRAWSPAPGPIGTLLPILEQIDQSVTEADMPALVFLAAKAVFDKAAAGGWEELDIACVHDQLSGESSPGELA